MFHQPKFYPSSSWSRIRCQIEKAVRMREARFVGFEEYHLLPVGINFSIHKLLLLNCISSPWKSVLKKKTNQIQNAFGSVLPMKWKHVHDNNLSIEGTFFYQSHILFEKVGMKRHCDY